MSKHRGRKRNNYISERDKIMHNLNELFGPMSINWTVKKGN